MSLVMVVPIDEGDDNYKRVLLIKTNIVLM